MLSTALRLHFALKKSDVVLAFIKPDNAASIRAFERSNFRFDCIHSVNGSESLRYKIESGDLK